MCSKRKIASPISSRRDVCVTVCITIYNCIELHINMDFNLMEIICMNAYGIIYLNANELQFSLNKITDIRTVGFAACVCVCFPLNMWL